MYSLLGYYHPHSQNSRSAATIEIIEQSIIGGGN